MSRPVIGISADCLREDNPKTGGKIFLNWNYVQVIADAGGLPIMLPPNTDPVEAAALIDGLVIPGGDDIDASEYGHENHPKSELQDPARFAFEAALYRAAPRDLPILGICYGCQFLNVLHRGTLQQHVPDVVGDDHHTTGTTEKYSLQEGKLSAALGSTQVSGPSYHHQAIGQPGIGVQVVGTAEDGTIEAIEIENRAWTLGVQWHPERAADDPAMLNLFRAFIEAASEYKRNRQA